MEEFDGIQHHDKFVKWREKYPEGYVINYRAGKVPMLHKAGCTHFDFNPHTKALLTKRKKVCSLDRHELEDSCIQEYGTKPVPCGHCLKGALPI